MALTPAQDNLAQSIGRALERDEAIEAAWIAGSLGAGRGDEFSDIDLVTVTSPGMVAEVGGRYAKDVGLITRPVLVKTLFGGRILNVITSDWQRFDISFIEPEELTRFDGGALTPLFNKTGLTVQRLPNPAYVTSTDTLMKLVNEFLRMMGLLVVALGRREWINGQSGVDLVRRLTTDLLLEVNGIGPMQRGGALHLNTLLTPAQRIELEALPPVGPTRESLLEANLRLAGIFLPAARQLAKEINLIWPMDFEQATREHLRQALAVTLP